MRALGLVAIASGAVACGFSGRGAPVDGGDDDGGDDAASDPDADSPTPDAEAGSPDASTDFNPASCPADYTITVTASPSSRYRFINTLHSFETQDADCNDDHAGWTHLASFESVDEASAAAHVNPEMFAYAYFGAVQDNDATEVDGGWYSYGGGTLVANWGFDAPDDGDNGTRHEDGEEQRATIKDDGGMQDVTGIYDYRAICECDGIPIDPDVVDILDD